MLTSKLSNPASFPKFATLILISTFMIASINCNDDDSTAINVRDYQDLIDSRPEEIQENCELDEMAAYSLIGDAQTLGEPNELCPSVSQNCCGSVDQENIQNLWYKDSQRIQNYTTYNLKVLRYILGNGQNFFKIASRIADDYKRKTSENFQSVNMQTSGELEEEEESSAYELNTNKYCFDAAEFVLTKNFFDKEVVEPFYHQLNQKAEYLHNVRASFYCMLCSVEGQTAISSWRLVQSASNVNYGTGFCKEIVAHTFQITLQLYDNYNEVLSNIIKLLTCVKVPDENRTENENAGANTNIDYSDSVDYESEDPPYELSEAVEELIENPLGMSDYGSTYACDFATGDDTLWFTKCEYYCQKFNIAQASPFFEYDSFRFRNLFDYVRQYEPIFPEGADINVFNDDTISLKKEITELYSKLPYEGLFFISKSDRIDIAKYSSDFTRMSSFNPMELAEGHMLEFHYESSGVVGVIFMFFLGLLLKF